MSNLNSLSFVHVVVTPFRSLKMTMCTLPFWFLFIYISYFTCYTGTFVCKRLWGRKKKKTQNAILTSPASS